jgi:hypothetical protein
VTHRQPLLATTSLAARRWPLPQLPAPPADQSEIRTDSPSQRTPSQIHPASCSQMPTCARPCAPTAARSCSQPERDSASSTRDSPTGYLDELDAATPGFQRWLAAGPTTRQRPQPVAQTGRRAAAIRRGPALTKRSPLQRGTLQRLVEANTRIGALARSEAPSPSCSPVLVVRGTTKSLAHPCRGEHTRAVAKTWT